MFRISTNHVPTSCPGLLHFVLQSFSCMDTSSSDLQVAQARAAETVAPLQESLGSKSLSEAQKEAFAEKWQTLVHSKFDGLDDEEDAFQWSLLWHMANATNSAGLMSSWPEILEALSGKRTIDWSSTRLHWEKVLFTALLRLQIREVHSHDPTDVQDERSLSQVFLNLQSIYETKICSPGALGGLKDEHLRRLGVGKEDLVQLALHQIDKEEVIKGLWRNWMVLHVQVPSSKKHFLKALRESKCRCMCYQACHDCHGQFLPVSPHISLYLPVYKCKTRHNKAIQGLCGVKFGRNSSRMRWQMACFVRNISHVKVPCRNRYMCLVSQFLLFLCMFIYIQTSTLNKSNAPFKRVGRCEGPCC